MSWTRARISIVGGWLALAAALASSPASAASIPFVAASVESADGRVFAIDWKAPGVRHVQVYAGTDPDHVGRERRVAGGAGDGKAVVAGLPPAARWYFRLVPDHGEALVVADRSLHLTTAGNFRDVGGYRTADGHWVRMGVAYRSNALDSLTPNEAASVSGLRLKLITDLRTEVERQRAPDQAPPGVSDLPADVLADNSGKIRAEMKPPAQTPGADERKAWLRAVYLDFVDLDSAHKAYHATFERLANRSNAPSVFHCSAGKDRTGWADAVLLTILGVPRATILRDYELTNAYLTGAALDHLHQTFGGTPPAGRGDILADPTDLEASFDEVTLRYGSFDNYLRDGLGLDQQTLRAIRRAFLVG